MTEYEADLQWCCEEYQRQMAQDKLKKTAWTKRPKDVELSVFLRQFNKPTKEID